MTNNIIEFRTEFEKIVNDDNRDALQKVFREFHRENFDRVIRILWYLWRVTKSVDYKLEGAMTVAEKFLNSHELCGLIKPEDIGLLRSEFYYQYELRNPSFFHVTAKNEDCLLAFEKMLNTTKDFSIVYYVYEQFILMLSIYRGTPDLEQILFLIGNGDNLNFFAGMERLNFRWPELYYLKAYREQIYEMFKAIHEYSLSDEVKNERVAPILEDPYSMRHRYEPLTAERVLENLDLFRAYLNDDMNAAKQLGEFGLGFDLDEIETKKEKFSVLFNAIKAFNE